MTTRAGRLLANLSVGVIGLAVAFLIGEGIVRLLYGKEAAPFPRYHTGYQYGRYTIRGVRPNMEYWQTSVDGSWRFVTNSRGIRDTREFDYRKPPNTLRVLSLGDSHTQGFEVRQEFTFSAVLERFLRHKGKRAEVINAGISGFSTAEQLVLLENEGIRYDPDVVIVGFSANDFEDNLKAGLFGLDGQGRLTEEKFEHVPGVRIQNVIYSVPFVRWLSENSYFYALLFNNVWKYFKERLSDSALKQAATRDTSSPALGGSFEYAVPTSTNLPRYLVGLAAALLERMHFFCVERGVRFMVVDIPTRAGDFGYRSSLPAALRDRLNVAGVERIASGAFLENFDGISEIHVPHGQGHMSELTHALIAIESGRRILSPRTIAKRK